MSKTVLETKEQSVVAEESVEKEVKKPRKRKTITNWSVFEEGGFIPIRIKCETYKGGQPSDQVCHTAFPPTAENVIRHMLPEHGIGSFRIKFRITDGKKSTLWKELEEAGVEIQEFICPHCREEVSMTPRRIVYHLQNHPGATRVNFDPQVLAMSLGYQTPELEESESLYMNSVED